VPDRILNLGCPVELATAGQLVSFAHRSSIAKPGRVEASERKAGGTRCAPPLYARQDSEPRLFGRIRGCRTACEFRSSFFHRETRQGRSVQA
jgi:hypothetical protein